MVRKPAYFDQSDPRPLREGIDTLAGINYLTLGYTDSQEVVNRIATVGIPILGHIVRETCPLVFIRDPDRVFPELAGPPRACGRVGLNLGRYGFEEYESKSGK